MSFFGSYLDSLSVLEYIASVAGRCYANNEMESVREEVNMH